MAVSATGPGKGGGLLERPVIEKTTPARDSEFDLRYWLNFNLLFSYIVYMAIWSYIFTPYKCLV